MINYSAPSLECLEDLVRSRQTGKKGLTGKAAETAVRSYSTRHCVRSWVCPTNRPQDVCEHVPQSTQSSELQSGGLNKPMCLSIHGGINTIVETGGQKYYQK